MAKEIPELLYQGELVSYPGPWSFQLGKSALILTSDRDLEELADPDRKIDLSLTHEKAVKSLRQVCEEARAAGHRTLIVAFDHFFRQYRPGQDAPRRLTPDTDEYIRRIAALSRFAQGFGLGLELSLLSPLEVGPAYRRATGESGLWMHYRKGLRDPVSGAYSVQLWQQLQWANNKGAVALEDAGVRIFAFREKNVRGTPHRAVDPAAIVEVTGSARVEVWDNLRRGSTDYQARRIRVHGQGGPAAGELNRVLVVQQYRSPEMDYFSPKALPFLKELIDRYHAAGVKLHGLYADEMHIQQDWGYFSHHDHGELALRYVSPALAERFAERHGAEHRDFARYLVYFAYGQEDFANDLSAKAGVDHVFGESPEDIRRTALFRSRYYRLLQDGVVDLFVAAKRHAEQKAGHRLESRAHATWAESPTIDRWESGEENQYRHQYEYTSNFVWSNTVHQAASACHDYFKWGDFLTGNGNDHAECGWSDRDYVGLALACSTGILNEVPYSYGAHWGMPAELSKRRTALVNAFGASAAAPYGAVEDLQHRDVEVLFLYPLDLVSVEERFGSWMTQYAYANSVTAAKLLERGRVVAGGIEMAGRRFTTLAAAFEPFPPRRLLAFMREFAEAGGRLVWSGPPPVLTAEGEAALAAWQELFGVAHQPTKGDGFLAPGQEVRFGGVLAGVAPQIILTDFLVDRIHPVGPLEGTETVATAKGRIVGTHRRLGRGTATFLGYRPRDDQSRSLGYDARNWFEVLSALGAYPPTGRFPGVNDNPEHLSRTTGYLCCRFPNGAVAVAPHFRETEEDWPGGFARREEEDAAYLKRCPPSSEKISLRGFKVNGHVVDYEGVHALAFRAGEAGGLRAFAGQKCREITVDGRKTVFAEREVEEIAWAPVAADRRVPGGALLQVMVRGADEVRIPAEGLPAAVEAVAEGHAPGSRGALVPCSRAGDALVLSVPAAAAGRWIYVVPKKG
jgi:hypothetical protein